MTSDSAIFLEIVGLSLVRIKTIVALTKLHQEVSVVLPILFQKNICSLKSAKKCENSASTEKTIFLKRKETIYLREQNLKTPYGVQVDFNLITH